MAHAWQATRRAARLFGHFVRFNLRAGMGYRASFLVQVFGMILNNSAFIVFWVILYGQLGSIRGYGLSDVMFLWALSATGFGLAGVFLGNASYLSRSIYMGELDVYLLQPKPVLANFLLSRMSISAWGDITFGLVLFVFTQALAAGRVALFLLFSLLMAAVFTAVRVFWHSLTFFLGNAEDFATTASELPIAFTLYPGSIFDGPATVLLHTLIPAALIAYIPAEIFRTFDLVRLLELLGADAVVLAVAWGAFRLGLRAYESGSRMGARL